VMRASPKRTSGMPRYKQNSLGGAAITRLTRARPQAF
jgi:hypothetical protein